MGIILCCDGLYLIMLQLDKRGFLVKESTLQTKFSHKMTQSS